jgi:chorismate dehydratase
VFAVWIVRQEAATEKREQLIAFHQSVKAAVEEARADFAGLADGLVNYDWISKEKVVQYWKGIDFSLTSQHTKGLLTFYADAEELNLVDHAPNEIEFMEMPI